ncbi:hypothetical protein C0583_02475 [Candidatus Parcubacteria bacterium]|nr:MAG: hypothetical protein C0583_02475 [Candidatus Parcubacteria bacterium]
MNTIGSVLIFFGIFIGITFRIPESYFEKEEKVTLVNKIIVYSSFTLVFSGLGCYIFKTALG